MSAPLRNPRRWTDETGRVRVLETRDGYHLVIDGEGIGTFLSFYSAETRAWIELYDEPVVWRPAS